MSLFCTFSFMRISDPVLVFLISSFQCMHGSKCKIGSYCTVGRRLQEVNILGGLILPVWGTIEKALAKQVHFYAYSLQVVLFTSMPILCKLYCCWLLSWVKWCDSSGFSSLIWFKDMSYYLYFCIGPSMVESRYGSENWWLINESTRNTLYRQGSSRAYRNTPNQRRSLPNLDQLP